VINHTDIDASQVLQKIRCRDICFAGNNKLKIYGTLKCGHGKKLKRENRVFFKSEKEAADNGFRACKHCMKKEI
jgi:methylphosphotriester-DNA--protein-cysteine methyltransferase